VSATRAKVPPTRPDWDAYLERIRVDTLPAITRDGLELLHRAHAYSIPFENFDILLGRGIDLSLEHLFQKIISQSRGGYCFELNGLFLELLRGIGFDATPLLARVHTRGNPSGRHHQLSLVKLGGREWLADVGFGANGLRAPIPFETDRVNTQDGQDFRLLESPPWGYMLQFFEEDAWQNLYSFDLEHVCMADIYSGNHYTSTSPYSFFTWSRVATLPNESGRVSLSDFNLTVISDGRVEKITLDDSPNYLDKIREYFGIVLNEPYEKIQPLNRKPGTR
jgi:N-hydroxyarylamine O-acetyltransferase